jgi:hypothetical protein
MKSKSSTWFETKVRYDKLQDNGTSKKVIESFVVEAYGWGKAEKKLQDEMFNYIPGPYSITAMSRPRYSEIFFSDFDKDDKWYKAKLEFITIDEKSDKEKRSAVHYLVQGSSVENARSNIEMVMDQTMIDYEIKSIVETKIVDVFTDEKTGGSDNQPE